MRTFVKLFFIVSITFLAVGSLSAVVIRDRPTAEPQANSIILRWNTVDEAGVQQFEVWRRVGQEGDFTKRETIAAKGVNNSSYQFIDSDIFKTEGRIFQYKIRVINGQNPPPESEIVTVSNFISSTAQRTWGSIKAMFR
ncbi:MAG: hypothetical protein ACRDGA_10845 [Bacteroidota bacterium]